MENKLNNPKETICLISYKEPISVKDICKILYNKDRNSRVSGWISELLKKGWIKHHEKLPKDRRYTYLKSTNKSIFDSIIKELKRKNIKLDEGEKKRLKHFIYSKHFKKFACDIINQIDFKKSPEDFSIIKNQLCYLCAFHAFMLRFIVKQDFDIEYIIGHKLDDEEDPIDQLPDEFLDKLLKDAEERDTLNKSLTMLWFPLLYKLSKLDEYTSKTLCSYLSRFVENNAWFPT